MSKIIKAGFVIEKRKDLLKNIASDRPVQENEWGSSEHLTQETADALYYETKVMLEELIIKAQKKADEIILKAKEEAQEKLEQAENECQRMKDDAYNCGYEQGYKKGSEESSGDMSAQYEGLLKLIKEFSEVKETYLKKQEKEMVELVVALTEKILGTIIDARPEAISHIIKNTLEHVKGAQKITIKVNPVHIPYLSGYNETFKDHNPESIQIQEDPNIKPGDCQVITENGFVDYLFDEQLNELKQALLEVVDHE